MSKSVKVLGLDLSTATGWALTEYAKGWDPKVVTFGMIQPRKVHGWERVNTIASQVMEQVEAHKPDLVSIEGYGFSQFSSIVVLAEIGSVIRFLFWQNEIPFIDVPPSSLKKFLTGSGKAKKDMMIMYVYQKYGVEVATNDEADAIALAMFGLCAAGVPFTAAQRETVRSVLKLHIPLSKYLGELTTRCS